MTSCQKQIDELKARVSKLEGVAPTEPVKPPEKPERPPVTPAALDWGTLQNYALTHGVQFAALPQLMEYAIAHPGLSPQATIDAFNANPNWQAPAQQPSTGVGQVGSGEAGQLDAHSLTDDDMQYYVRHPDTWPKVADSQYLHLRIAEFQSQSGGTKYNPSWDESSYRGVLKG